MPWPRPRASGSDFVGLLRAGDPTAWESFYGDLAGPVAGYARAKGVRDVDDLVGDVFAAAAERIGRFDGDERQLRSWIFTVAHHRLADEHRRRRRHRTDPVEPSTLDVGDTSGSAFDASLDRLDADGALAMLDHLTEDQKEVLVLRILGDLSLAETAEITGKPVGAVKALQHRAVARLQREVATDPYPTASADDDTDDDG